MLAMLDEKSKGKEIVIDTAPAPKRGQVIDIMEALNAAWKESPPKGNGPLLSRRQRRKRRFRRVRPPTLAPAIIAIRKSNRRHYNKILDAACIPQ